MLSNFLTFLIINGFWDIHLGMENNLKLIDCVNAVAEFHDSFGIPNKYTPIAKVDEKDLKLRYSLMKEENEEYLQAAKEGDLTEIADALGDMLYIICGTILTHGLQYKMAEVFQEIQRSNMSKLDKNGKPIFREDGKVLKSDLYFKPNIKKILDN